jgi:hypothetical protein
MIIDVQTNPRDCFGIFIKKVIEMTIDTLPDELLITAFSNLSIRDQGRTNCVSHKWSDIGNKNSLWEQHAEKLSWVATYSWGSAEHKFDFTKSLKEQIKGCQISIPNAKIFPILQGINSDRSIRYVGRIDFTFKPGGQRLEVDQRLSLAKQAMTHLPDNRFVSLSFGGGYEIIYKEKDKIDTWYYDCGGSNPMCGPSDEDSEKMNSFRARMIPVGVERDDEDDDFDDSM